MNRFVYTSRRWYQLSPDGRLLASGPLHHKPLTKKGT